LAVRLIVVSAVVLSSTHALEKVIVEILTPALPALLHFLDDTFVVTQVTVDENKPDATLYVSADVTHPVDNGLRGLYPRGWGGRDSGGITVTYTLGAIVQCCSLALIAILVWPLGGTWEVVIRLLLYAPLMGLVVLFEVPCTLISGLWTFVNGQLNSDLNRGLIVWGEFFGGGGGLMAAVIAALLCIVIAHRINHARQGPHHAQPLVS